MIEHLSDKEKMVLNFIKEDYDKRQLNPLSSINPILELNVTEDITEILQQKGFIEITKTELGSNMEMVSITLKDKFFEYYGMI